MKRVVFLSIALLATMRTALFAQKPAVVPAAPDDTPSVRVGSTLFADWTFQESPRVTDANGDRVNLNAFNVSRAYINVTGQLNHRIAYRITPEVTRENGTGSSLNGSLTFRLKFAYGQFNLDDWATQGSFVRFGLQQTPWIDFEESVYRYRFQGTTFPDREGYLVASDFGLAGKYNLPSNYGEIYAGFYNGESFLRPEANDQKALQLRATVRPLPRAGMWKGLRLSAFYDGDNYVANAKRQRLIGAVTFEHPRVNVGAEVLHAKDRTTARNPMVEGQGFSIWATPKLVRGWELLFRHDELEPDDRTDQERARNILGVAYWFQNLNRVTAALMADYDTLEQSGVSPSRPDETRYGLKMLINF